MRMRGKFPALRGLIMIGLVPLTGLPAGELNFWPAYVRQEGSAAGRPDHAGSLGPLLSRTDRDATRILSLRPLWTSFYHGDSGSSSHHLVYPVANWAERSQIDSGHVLNLLQYRRDSGRDETFLQLFPFVFSKRTPRIEDSYFALWPLGGTLKNRFWRDRISFAAWPLYVRTVKEDQVRTHFPYPFLRVQHGPRSSGFGVWPVYGHFQREQDYSHTWALWPLFYHYRDKLDQEQPYARFGALPFYHRETAPGLRSETFAWPFFGYTREAAPRPLYSENRYFWPLLVQGRGEERHVNRWMPLFTHERKRTYEKRWYLWPLLKTETFHPPGPERRRASLLYFIYRDERQLLAASQARLTFIWPLIGYWHDGHDRTQLQVLDPLSVFFPSNQKVKENWTPLFALYRFDARGGNSRHSLLWDLLVWEKDPAGADAFYLGPLFEWEQDSHWQVLKGLFGVQRENGRLRLRLFWQP
jgi:hypothetical protein